MPRTETVLQAFVASPSDVSDERGLLEDVVRELNQTWSRTLGLRVDLVKWETHAFPAMGEDAQSVINQQIGDEYDIFIGIMWGRFGTPTGRFGSGTEEEFNRALSRFVSDSNSVHVMFYFKDAGIAPSKIDVNQLTAVQAFRSSLGTEGSLYWSYTSREEFSQLVRVHLSRVVQGWKNKRESTRASEGAVAEQLIVQSPQNVGAIENDDESGFLDVVLIGQDRFQELTSISVRMKSATEELGEKFKLRTAELEELNETGKPIDLRAAARISNRLATDIDDFSIRMEIELPLFSKASRTAIESMTKAVNLLSDFKPQSSDEIQETISMVTEFIAAIGELRNGNTRFMASIAGLPRVTGNFQKSRRRALNCLSKLDSEISANQNLTLELVKLLKELPTSS